MSPTTHSVRILWQTLDSNPSGTVYYGKTPDLGQKVTAETGWNVDGEGFVHVIELTGLEPFTEYYYQVGDESRRYERFVQRKQPQRKEPISVWSRSAMYMITMKRFGRTRLRLCWVSIPICGLLSAIW